MDGFFGSLGGTARLISFGRGLTPIDMRRPYCNDRWRGCDWTTRPRTYLGYCSTFYGWYAIT